MLIQKLSKRERLILIGCIALIATAILYNFILEPFVKKWTELSSEARIMKLKFKKSTEILKRRIEITERYEDISSYVGPQAGSDEEEIANLLSEIEKLASSSNVRITDIKPRPAKRLDYYKKYVVEVESEGDIARLTKFIYGVQTSPHLLSIEKFSLSMKGTAHQVLRANMTVTKILP
jgi:Tfp pilus assembly protein PilO